MSAAERVPAGVPAGGQFAVHDRDDAAIALAGAPNLEDLIVQLRGGTRGRWDPSHEAFVVDPVELGLAYREVPGEYRPDIESEINSWRGHDMSTLVVEEIPIDQLFISQDGLRADALAWYLEQDDPEVFFDDQKSWYGAGGPLVASVGEHYVVLDGCHRFARAKLRGETTFPCRVLAPRTSRS